jgi:serine/threonine-protein kinase
MNDDLSDHLGELFERAVGLPPESRAQFVDACSNDPALQSELRSLLAAYERSPNLLEQIAAELSPAALCSGVDDSAVEGHLQDSDPAKVPSRPSRSTGGARIEPGTHLGRYQIEECIGAGGLGVVYRAVDTTLHRPVALKTLSRHTSNARESLLREARAASALNHPHICTIYEVAEHDGLPFIAMEYVEGRSLREQIPADGLLPEPAMRYGIQIARALEHAHRRGIIHCDLKSANVMVTPDGQAKVLDFGLSGRMARSDPDLTRASSTPPNGPIAGTLPYLAPERVNGEPADTRTDVWALGVLLYEMVSGRLPFVGPGRKQLVGDILQTVHPPLATHVPPPLRAIVDRCLEKNPARRFQEAGEVRSALEAVKLPADSAQGWRRIVSAVAGVPERTIVSRVHLLWPAVLLLTIALGVMMLFNSLWRSSDVSPTVPAPIGSIAVWRGSDVSPPVRPPIGTIAVLPFEDPTGDPAQDYFVDGLTEALTTELAHLHTVSVMSARTFMQYKRKNTMLSRIARELKVDVVVKGRATLTDRRVTVAMDLIHTNTDSRMWEMKPRVVALQDLAALQLEIVRSVAAAIHETPPAALQARNVAPVDAEAYDLFLMGQASVVPSKRPSYFEAAIAKAPDFAKAYSALAQAWWMCVVDCLFSPNEVLPKAEAAAHEAVRLDASLEEPHRVLASIREMYGDRSQADAETWQARALSPNTAEAFAEEARACMRTRKFDQAVQAARRARELDPLNPNRTVWVARALRAAGQYDGAIAELRTALQMVPVYAAPVYAATVYFQVGATFILRGDTNAAIEDLEKSLKLSRTRNPMVLALLGYADVGAGRESEAWRILQELRARRKQEYVSAFGIALILDALGEQQETLAWLQTAREEHALEFTQPDNYPAFKSLGPNGRSEQSSGSLRR